MNDWRDIHPDFTKTDRWNKEPCQQKWEELTFNYQQTEQWIKVGLKPHDYEFATYLRWKGQQPSSIVNLEQWREEFTTAQNYLDCFYPRHLRNTIKELNITSFGKNRKNLTGTLDLSDFTNLESLNCSRHQLTDLKLNNCLKLKKLIGWDNQLTQLDLTNCCQLEEIWSRANYLQELKLPSQPEHLIILDVNDNNFPEQDLSGFSRLVNLRKLYLGNCSVYLRDDEKIKAKINQGFYNRFTGSLQYLKDLNKLEKLDIRNTNLNSGLEYLPASIQDFCCSAKEIPQARCQALANLLVNKQGVVEMEEWDRRIKDFAQKLPEYKQKVQAWVEVLPKNNS